MPTLFSYPELRNLDKSTASRGIIEGIIDHLQATQEEPKDGYSPQKQAAYVLNRLKFYAEVESNHSLSLDDFLTTAALKEEYNSLEVLRNPKATEEEKKHAFAGLKQAQPYIEKALDILGITKLATTEEIAAVNILVNLAPATMIAIGDTKNSYRKGVIKEAHEPPQLSQEFLARYDLTAAKVKAYQDSIRVFRGSITDETIKALGKETFEYKSINPLALIVVLATAMRYGATNMDGVHLVPVTQIVFGHETYTGYRRLADAISDLKVTPADIADRMAKTAGNGTKFGHLDLFSLKMLESIPETDKEILDQIKAETPRRIKQIEAIGHAPIEKARLERMLAAAKSDDKSAQNTAIALKLRETLENVKLHAKIIGYTALEGQLQNSLEDIGEGSADEALQLRALTENIHQQLESGEPIEEIELEEEEANEHEQDEEAEVREDLEIERTDGEEAQEEENDQDDDDDDEEQNEQKEDREDPEVDRDPEAGEDEEENEEEEEEEENDEDDEEQDEPDAEGENNNEEEDDVDNDHGTDAAGENNDDDDDEELATGGNTTEIAQEIEINVEQESEDIDLAISKSGLTLSKEVKDQIKNLFIWTRKEGPTTPIDYCLSVISQANANEFINYQDRNGNTPLMLAAKNSHNGMVERLLQSGANPNLINKQRKTALDLAQESKARLEAKQKETRAALESQKAAKPAEEPANKAKHTTVKERKAAIESAKTVKGTKTETQKLKEELQRIDKALAANIIIEQDLTKAMQEAETKGLGEEQENPPPMVEDGAPEGTVANTRGVFEQHKERPPHLDQGKLRKGSGNTPETGPKTAAEKNDDNSTKSSQPGNGSS